MLRGQASLQELIGRSFMSRKRSGSQGKKQQAPANAAQTPADNAHLQEMPGSDQQQQQQHQQERQQQQQSLQPGQVCCPVCGAAILEKAMNTHLDACLARETLQRSKGDAKQSTLAFQQSTRPSSAASATITTSSKLQRSTTAAATTKKGQSSNKRVRRASSDSALLLPQQQSGQQQSEQRQPAAQAAPDSQHLTLPVKPWQPNLRPQGNPDHGVTDRSPINEQSPFSSPVKSASGPLKDVQNDDNVQLLSPKSAARQLDGSVLVQTSIVGRRFRTGVTCCQHTPVCLNRQPENIRDPNAIQVLDSTSKQVLGYLPRDIAQHLAGLLDTVSVEVTATVEEPKSIAAVVPITLQITPGNSADCDKTTLDGVLDELIRTAAEWQANGLKRQGSGTGACLRTNFLLMADTVMQQDAHLLDDVEKQLLSSFKDLADEAQCLFLRLFLRKGPWFRLNTLSYSELSEPLTAAQELSETKMAECSSTDAKHQQQQQQQQPHPQQQQQPHPQQQQQQQQPQLVYELAEALSVAELQQLIVSLDLTPQGKSSGGSKGQMLQRLQAGVAQAEDAQQVQMRQQILDLIGPCIKLLNPPCAVVRRVQRLFFLNEAQNLSSFLVADLGVAKYPSYRVSRSRSVFTTRQDLLDYEQALLHAAELDNALEDFDTAATEKALQPAFAAISADLHKQQPSACHGDCSAIQLPFFLRYSAAWVYAAMATTGVSLLEKRKQWQQAVELLQQLLGGVCCLKRRGEWWTRLSLDLEHLGRPDESLEMAEAALADEWVLNGDRIALQRRVLRLGKPPRRWKRPSWAAVALREPLEVRIEGRPLASVLGIKSRFIGNGGEECSVEELALQYYAAEDKGAWTGTHAEGGIWATLFGLLMWDILFMDVSDVFQTAFQTAPLDLGTVVFYPTRQAAIEKRLSQIREGQATALLQHCWQQHLGEWCRGVNWERHSLDELLSICMCVGGQGLAAICKLLAQDFSGWAGGMPDLLLWNVHTCKAKLSEVKGPRDRLSEQQRAWINALIDAEVDVEVLKVVEPRQGNAPKRRKKW